MNRSTLAALSAIAAALATGCAPSTQRRWLKIASLRYLDVFTKLEGRWFFAERQLLVDWIDERAMA